jgi:phosphatidylglycerol lysyltransferase
VEPEILSRLRDRMVFVAERDGEVVAFLIASPVPLRRGWLIEQIVRSGSAPNGTAELLIDAAVSVMAARGDGYVTLGLAPLSRRAGVPADDGPVWLRLLLGWARAHLHRFYNFEGLEAFKAKFRPSAWEPIYLISDEPRVRVRPLRAVPAPSAAARSPRRSPAPSPPPPVRRRAGSSAGRELSPRDRRDW